MQLNQKSGVVKPSGGFFIAQNKVEQDPVFQFLRRCKQDINFYFKLLGFKPTWQQRQLVDAFLDEHPNIAVRSGKGPGKTTIAGIMIPWWGLTHVDSRTIVTAPTMRQCKEVWLAEAERWIRNGDPRLRYFFNFTNTGYGIGGNKNSQWGCILATATSPEAFQGLHNKNMLIYCEEASGIPNGIMQTIQDTLSGQRKKKEGGQNVCVAVGNPNHRMCRFYDFFNSQASRWWTLHWNAEETPESVWFSHERNRELEAEFGKDSDVYRVAVLGEFPSLDPNALISEADLMKCFGPEAYARAFKHSDAKKQVGVDLARFGGDECVSIFRNGRICLTMEAKARIDPIDWIERAVVLQDQFKWTDKECTYVVDTSGMGESAVGFLGSKKRLGKRVHEFYSQNTAMESQKYANKITEAWCGFAKMVRSGDLYLGTKPDRRLVVQLTNRLYKIDKDGRILIESKDDYKKRMADNDTGGDLGKSPDRADAMVMAFYEHASESQRIAIG